MNIQAKLMLDNEIQVFKNGITKVSNQVAETERGIKDPGASYVTEGIYFPEN